VLTAGNGYAVVLGQSGGTDAVRLVRYATGLRGTLTDMIVSNTSGLADFGAEYLSIRVTYNTFNNEWELFVRNDGSSAFADPATGTLVSQGVLVNTTHTGTSLGTMGAVWNAGTAANQPAFFDNVSVIVTPSQKTYSGATGGNWGVSTNWTPAGVPTATDDVIIPNNIVVTVNVAATCRNMRIAGGDQASTVTISGSNSLTVTDLIEFLAGTGSGDDKRIAVEAGTLTAARVTMPTTGNNNRDCAITVTSGTLNISTSVIMADANEARNFIELTGAGTFNLAGSISGGDIVPGSASTVNFNGTNAQTIPFGNYTYFNLHVNNTNASGATLGAAVTTSLVTGNLRVESGRLNNGGFAVTGNAARTFSVGANATFRITGTSNMATGFGTFTFDPTSTVEFNSTGTQTIIARSFGNLWITNTGDKVFSGAWSITGNYRQTNGAVEFNGGTSLRTFSVAGNISVEGGSIDWASGSGTTVMNLSGNLSVTGSATLNTTTGTTTTLNGAIRFVGTSGVQTLSYASPGNVDYTNLTVTNGASLELLSGIQLNRNTAVAWRGTLLVENGGTLNLGTQVVTSQSTDNNAVFTQQSGATLITSAATGLPANFNTANLTATFSSGGNFEFRGAATGTFTTTPTAGTVNNLTFNRPSNTVTLGQAFAVAGVLNITSTTTAIAGTNLITGASLTTTGTGLLRTANTSASPIPVGRTWSFDVEFNAATAQTVPAGTYAGTLQSSNTAGLTLAGNANVVTTLNLSAGNLNISTFKLQLQGNISGAGIINATNGQVEYAGSAAQTIDASRFTSALISRLEMNKSSVANTVSINGALSIDSLLQLSRGTLALGSSDIILVSNATRTVRVGQTSAPADVAITYGTGRFLHQRFIPGTPTAKRAWRLITVPLSNTSSVFDSWQNGGTYTAFQGMHITSPGASGPSGNGLDMSATNITSLRLWNQTTQAYFNLTNTKTSNVSRGTGSSAANTGYFAFVRGDRTPSFLDFGSAGTSVTTLSAKGELQYGDQLFTNVAPNAEQFTLIGNPYAAPVDLNLVFGNTGTNRIQRKVYSWDARLSGANGVGGYVAVSEDIPNSGDFVSDPDNTGISQILQSGQATFFITASGSGAPAIEFKEANKVTPVDQSFLRPASPLSTIPVFRANLFLLNTADNSTQFADGASARFATSFCNCVDVQDNIKLTNTNETFGFVRNGAFLATERRAGLLTNVNDTLQIRLTRSSERSYQLHLIPQALPGGLTARLIDSYTNVETSLSLSDTNRINFVINADAASKNQDRFRVVFGPMGGPLPVTFTNIAARQQNRDIEVSWDVANQTNVARYEVERAADGRSFRKVQDVAAVGANGSSNTYRFVDVNPSNGDHFYRVRSVDRDGQTQLTRVVKVTIGSGKTGITVYPNPVRDGVVGLQLNNLAAGVYQVRLMNMSGQQVMSQVLNHVGGSATEQLRPASVIAKGLYQLEIIATEGGARLTTQIVVE
jgi:hypothetical protein